MSICMSKSDLSRYAIGPTLPISKEVHSTKYCAPGETFEHAMHRVARTLSDDSEHQFALEDILLHQRFLPAGRIQSAIGASRKVTALNCLDGTTEIVTKEHGVVPIASVVGQIVHVVDGHGEWVKAEILDFGVQPLHKIVFTATRNGRPTEEVLATVEHAWIVDGQRVTTKDLRSKKMRVEMLSVLKTVEDETQYELGVRHGFIYGDGTAVQKPHEVWSFSTYYNVRVCEGKEEIETYFDTIPRSYPPSFGGEPLYMLHGENITAEFKELPDPLTVSHDYLLGFMRGWFAADGCVNTASEATLCLGKDEEMWVRQWGPTVGFVPMGSSALVLETNFGVRNKEVFNLRFHRQSLNEDDFLRLKHAERWREVELSGWGIRSVSAEPVKEDVVYCAVVPTTHSFALGCGIHSGNCFVSGTIEDNSDSIMTRAHEAFTTMRLGGGIGYDFSGLRPNGDLIHSLQSTASGPLSFMRIYDAVCATVRSAGHRRGAQMAVLRVDHPDIIDFVVAKHDQNTLTNFNVSVGITDEFMSCVRNDADFTFRFGGRNYDTVRARHLWKLIMESTWDWAEPGVLFLDTINRYNNLWYTENLCATNPCVAEGTLVSTKAGFVPVENVSEGDVVATVMEPGTVKTVEVHEWEPVYKVCLSDGTELRATAAHIFHVAEGKWFNSDRRLDDLVIGDRVRLAPSMMPTNKIENPFSMLTDREYGLLVGLVIGDGCYTEKSRSVKIAIRHDEPEWIETVHNLFKKVDDSAYVSKSTSVVDIVCSTKIMKVLDTTPLARGYSHEKYLPLEMLNSNEEFLSGFIDGMISTDGNINMNKSNPMIRITSTSKESLMMIKRALSCFGVLARVYPETSKSIGKCVEIEGRQVEYKNQGYVLVVLGDGLKTIHSMGVSRPSRRNRLREMVRTFSLTGCTWQATIKSIEPDGYAKVYDLFEPETDTWITDGVVNRGCGEQPLPPFGACLLGSVNLVKYVDPVAKKIDVNGMTKDLKSIVRAMDNIHDIATFPLPEQKDEAQNKRRMGIGLTGLANALEACGMPYGTDVFLSAQDAIQKMLTETCYITSTELAQEKGAFPLFDRDRYLESKFVKRLPHDIQAMIHRSGIRNSHLTSIAPSGTISLTADNVSSGIEPVFCHSYDRIIHMPDGVRTETVEDYGVRVFGVKGKTSAEVTVDEHVDVLITASKWVDSAVSKTCNVGDDVSFDQFSDIYMKAWLGGAKGCTTFRAAGKRMGILKAKEEKPVEEGSACTYDPSTGTRTCDQ